jgi:type II secretory pathway pseudopilin PulG
MTLVELMLAAAIFAVVTFILVGLIYEYNLGTKRLSASQHARAEVAHLLDQWESDQSSADAVFIPDSDVLGADNTTLPHEVDFYTKDASSRPYYWAYLYDAAAQTLQRYDYPNPGAAASKDGNPFTAITKFAPSLHAISEVTNASSPIYMPIFASAQNYDVPLGAGNKVVGGTHIVHIVLATANETVPVELEAGGAPSGFTVVLNYTPAPKATPLSVWPPAVQIPVSGGTLGALAYDGKPRDAGGWINAILGGGIAQASVAGCAAGQSRAFKDGTNWTSANVLANSGDPWGVLKTDVNGCISGAGNANVAAHEAGYGGAFKFVALSTCSGVVSGGFPWSGLGPTASTKSTATSAVTCTVDIQDANTTPQSKPVAVQVLPIVCGVGSLPIGSTCSGGAAVANNGAYCGGPGDYALGNTGAGKATASPTGLGTLFDGGDGTYRFTRTAPGAVTVTTVAYVVVSVGGTTGCLVKPDSNTTDIIN